MSAVTASYERRKPETTVLYKVIQENLETFLDQAESAGRSVPLFVRRELEGYLDCGQLSRGFCRVLCEVCKKEHLVAFSCKSRAICPSCGGRRMTERAAFLVDHVLPTAPVRQWVLTLPFQLRYIIAYNAKLCGKVLSLFVREVMRWYRHTAKKELGLDSVDEAHCGSVTFIQRADSGLRLNVHYHSVFLDGVYLMIEDVDEGTPKPRFYAMPAPTDEDVATVAIKTRERVLEMLAVEGFYLESDCGVDELAENEPLLAQLSQASITNMSAVGPNAGSPTGRLYDGEPYSYAAPEYVGTRCVNVEYFNVHANTRVKAAERKQLEKLLRYVARSPVSNQRLRELPDGRLAYDLKRTWSDGSTALVFEPLELVARLVPLIPPPRVNQVRFHGLLAPNSKLRGLIVRTPPAKSNDETKTAASTRPKNYCWSELMRRAHDLDVLECPACGGKMRLIAVIIEKDTIEAILKAHGMPTDSPPRAPARPDPQEDFWDAA